MEANDLERLAVLETNTSNIEKLVIRLDSKLDAYVSNHVTKPELTEALKWRDGQIGEIKESLKWARRLAITSITGGVLTIITGLIFYIIER